MKNSEDYKSEVTDQESGRVLIVGSKTKANKNDGHIFKSEISNSNEKDMDAPVEESNANGVKNLDYYKSLVSDEEVVEALLKENKAKESNANGVNNLNYYKSLVSDEEVVEALLKESKAKEMELVRDKARVRPNVIFLQRTVSNMVSSNKRVGATNNSAEKEIEKSTNKNGTKVKKNNLQVRSEPARFSKHPNSQSQVERTYGDSLDKYFVREAGNSTTKVHSHKSKNIVLNLNSNRDKCTTTPDVIWIPRKIKVICVSDSDSD